MFHCRDLGLGEAISFCGNEEMGGDEHVDSAIDSAVFQWLFPGRFGTLNCSLVRGNTIGICRSGPPSESCWVSGYRTQMTWLNRMILTPTQVR
jgi:hypothetical protein